MEQIISKIVTWWDAFIAFMSKPAPFTIFTAVLFMALGALLACSIARIGIKDEEGSENGDQE